MITIEQGWQGPLPPGLTKGARARLRICSHPALRLGFLDAQHGRPLNHDRIMQRIERETPPAALQRLGWISLFDRGAVEQAQYRYEEGRLLVIKYGLRCRSWNHPDYPPKAVREFALSRPDNEPL